MDISSPGHFSTCMFWPWGHTGTWTFRLHGHFDRTFQHRDILAQGIFGAMDISAWDISVSEQFSTWIFWHLAKQYGRFGTCRNVHGAEKSLCQKVPMPKSFCTKMSTEMKCPCAGTLTEPNRGQSKMSR